MSMGRQVSVMALRDKIICSRCGIYTSTEQAGGTLCERCRYPDPGEGPDVGDTPLEETRDENRY